MNTKFGPIITACRIRAGISQEKMAELLHRSRSCISKLENDQKKLDAETLLQWAEVTGAKEVIVAFFCGMDGISIMQNLFSLVGG